MFWMRVTIAVLIGLLIACHGLSAAEPEDAETTFRVFYIGNSLTDNIRYSELAAMAEQTGDHIIWGRHMIPGAPLNWLWDHQEGFTTKPYGPSKQALAEYRWDVISFQPFDRHIEGDDGDRNVINRYLEVAAPVNAEARILIYAHWPRMRVDGKGLRFDKNDFDPAKPAAEQLDLSKIDDFADLWDQPYKGRGSSGGAIEARDYYRQLAEALRKDHPDRAVTVVPVGEVMYRLHEKMKAGDIKGYTTVWQLYKDQIHLNATGCYLVGCTYYAVITGKSPVGLPAAPYGDVDAALVPLIQNTVAEVVFPDGPNKADQAGEQP